MNLDKWHFMSKIPVDDRFVLFMPYFDIPHNIKTGKYDSSPDYDWDPDTKVGWVDMHGKYLVNEKNLCSRWAYIPGNEPE